MWRACLFRRRRFGCTNIHALIDLATVSPNYFCAKAFTEAQAQRRFPHRRWPQQDNQWWRSHLVILSSCHLVCLPCHRMAQVLNCLQPPLPIHLNGDQIDPPRALPRHCLHIMGRHLA